MGCCRPSVPRRFSPGQRGFLLCSLLRGRGRAAPPSPPESGSRGPAEHEPGRERGGDARPPPPGRSLRIPGRQLRIPGLLASSPSAKRDRSSRQAGLRKDTERKRWRARSPRAGWKIADKGIFGNSRTSKRRVLPRTPRRDPRSRQSLCAWLERSRIVGAAPSVLLRFNLNTENYPPPLLRRPHPPAPSPGALALWGLQAGLGPAHTRRVLLGRRRRTRSLQRNGRARHPPYLRQGRTEDPWPLLAPATQGAPVRRCRLRGGGLSPACRPGTLGEKALCADLAWPPPPPSAAQENFSEMS